VKIPTLLRIFGAIGFALLVSGCAHVPPASDPGALAAFRENNDRLEPLNRALFKFDRTVDPILVRPVIWTYHNVVPAGVRKHVLTFKRHIGEPITFVHNLLQGRPVAAGKTVTRFVMNTTIGFLGFFDVAEKAGLEYRAEDFGQTMAVWGVGEGSYVYIPFLGPSTIRDGVGFGIDSFFVDPVAWYTYNPHNLQWVQWAQLGLIYVTEKDDNMEVLDELEKSSIDFYAALRSAYRQQRASQIRNGAPPPLEDLEAPE